jgi:hypothetical protein
MQYEGYSYVYARAKGHIQAGGSGCPPETTPAFSMPVPFCLPAHPDARGIDGNQFSAIVFHVYMEFEAAFQTLQEEGRDFRMVQDLEGDNASEPCR